MTAGAPLRLFFALNFDAAGLQRLAALQDALRGRGVTGGFSLRENLHLTLAFLGHTPPELLTALYRMLEHAPWPPASLVLSRPGLFDRPSDGVLWMGVRERPELPALHEYLRQALEREGVHIERRAFRAHLTLARRVSIPDGLDLQALTRPWSGQHIAVASMDLMQSRHMGGRLTYTSLCTRPVRSIKED